MAPFNVKCGTCGEYSYKGKEFNARKETAQSEANLGLPIFRFCISCPRCPAEITSKTDPQNTDYTVEHGASRNCQAEELLEEEERRQKEREEEELPNVCCLHPLSHSELPDATIPHCVDDIITCTITWRLSSQRQFCHARAGLEIEKIQHTCPWTYLDQ